MQPIDGLIAKMMMALVIFVIAFLTYQTVGCKRPSEKIEEDVFLPCNQKLVSTHGEMGYTMRDMRSDEKPEEYARHIFSPHGKEVVTKIVESRCSE